MENKGKGPARLEAGRAGCEPLVSSQQSNVLDLATTNPESGSTPRLKRNQMETVQDELNKMNEGYSPRSIKRKRYTPAELENLKNKLVEIAEEWGPLNTRGYFYQAEASGLVEKTEAECNRVERMLKELRAYSSCRTAFRTSASSTSKVTFLYRPRRPHHCQAAARCFSNCVRSLAVSCFHFTSETTAVSRPWTCRSERTKSNSKSPSQ